jgi:hypothetical protein
MLYISIALGHSVLTHTENLSSLTYENILSVEKYQTREWICLLFSTQACPKYQLIIFFYASLQKSRGLSPRLYVQYFMCLVKYKTRHFLHVESYHGRKKSSPKPLKIRLGFVSIFFKIRGDIRKSRCTTGINDTSGK